MNKALFSSKTCEWETPQWLFDHWNSMHHFSIDVCATKENAKCRWYYTKEDDALTKDWSKEQACWMNPPYGREIYHWVKKAFDTAKAGGKVVALLPARTDTKWFHEFILCKYNVLFLKRRLKFGNAKNSAPFPSMIVYFHGVDNAMSFPYWCRNMADMGK